MSSTSIFSSVSPFLSFSSVFIPFVASSPSVSPNHGQVQSIFLVQRARLWERKKQGTEEGKKTRRERHKPSIPMLPSASAFRLRASARALSTFFAFFRLSALFGPLVGSRPGLAPRRASCLVILSWLRFCDRRISVFFFCALAASFALDSTLGFLADGAIALFFPVRPVVRCVWLRSWCPDSANRPATRRSQTLLLG